VSKVNLILFGVAAFLCGAAINAQPSEPAVPAGPRFFEQPRNGYVLNHNASVGGLWVARERKDSPFAALYSQTWDGRDDVAVLGFSRNQKGKPHDFAIVVDGKEVFFQIRDAKGDCRFVPVAALLKLVEKEDAKAKDCGCAYSAAPVGLLGSPCTCNPTGQTPCVCGKPEFSPVPIVRDLATERLDKKQ
jgi:hypothetical protein